MSRVPRTIEAVAELVAVSLVTYAVVGGRVDATLGVCVVAAVLAGPAAVRAVVGRVAPDATRSPDTPPSDAPPDPSAARPRTDAGSSRPTTDSETPDEKRLR